MDLPSVRAKADEPRDKYKHVYIAIIVIGIGTVLPWNTFINANSYFVEHKLVDIKENNATQSDYSAYRNSFISYLGLFSMTPNLVLQVWNFLYKSQAGSVRRRMSISMIIETIVLVITIILAAVNTTSWTVAFFYLTMITIIVLNMAAGVFQNLSYALAAQLPMKYTNALMIGQNASGTAFAIALIVSISAAPDLRGSAITYFCIALAFMIVMFFLFQSVFRNRYYLSVAGAGSACSDSSSCEAFAAADDAATTPLTPLESMRKSWQLLSQCWTHVLNAFLVYFVGLSIFPAIQVGVKSTDHILSDTYFTPVTCFLLFNVTALTGTILTSGSIPIPGPRFLWIPVTLRLLFIPFFLLCNYDPLHTRTLAVWFSRDWLYCLGSGLQGLSLGYLGSLSVMYAPRIVAKEDSQTAGMMAGLACMLGMFTGVSTGFLWPVVIT